MTPNVMPMKSAPVRTTTRRGGFVPNCDYVRSDGSVCTCEGGKWHVVESVRVIRTPKRNPAMADALKAAGWQR